ncbi:MAG TPA: dihydrolipoamide acetyltransferase family protein [Trebonia sp.]|nr:dihydrolipoamide acetyltransferase family protein [Trebonia sp.]
MNKEFRLPDVGEGLTEADIVTWRVKPGDVVTINQVIVEIETAKSLVELPSPFAGTVSRLLVEESTTVDVGTPIIEIDDGVGTAGPADAPAGPAEAPAGLGTVPQGSTAEQPPTTESATRQPVLVGYGVRPGSTSRRPRRDPSTRPGSYPASPSMTSAPPALAPASAPAPARAVPPTPTPAQATSAPGTPVKAPATPAKAPEAAQPGRGARALAKPPVRRLARDLGIDLAALAGSGPQGTVTRDDVERAAARPAPARSVVGDEERVPVRGVRKATAGAMVASAFTAPHVTEFLQVDVTDTVAAVRRLRELPEFTGVKVSPLLLVARALLTAVGRHPMVNSTWDEAAQEIVVKHYVNLGIAVATDRGLLVPSLKGAHSMSLTELAHGLDQLAATARSGKATPADLSGGTITITNVGVFGVDAGTPILTPGEAAILAFGAIRDMPWVVDGQLAVRKVTTLSLSFDHRIVDGELGSAVLRDVGSMLEDPIRMLAWS